MTKLTVSSLSVYPVKSCRGIHQESTQVEKCGLKNDRRWMVVDESGVMLTQRKIAKMCLIQTEITTAGIILKSATLPPLHIDIPDSNRRCTVRVWNDPCQAYDAGDEAANWLSQALSTNCRLVYFPDDEFRQVDLDYSHEGDRTAFSDGFPFLLISQASLDDLNQRLTAPVSMSRFRPNLVIKGCQPFAEDTWKKIRIGEITYSLVKPCSRCVIPSINPETSEREEEPLKTLVNYRKRDNKIFFGQNVIADSTGNIEVGMNVEVISCT